MLLHVPEVLSASELQRVRAILSGGEWADGRITAGPQSASTKNNLQLPDDCPASLQARALVLGALGRSALFFTGALPRTIYPPLFNRYGGTANAFGNHVDNAIRQVRGSQRDTQHGRDTQNGIESKQWVRTDLSATLFLAAPSEYDGGELMIDDTYGSHSVKLPAGDLVLYPSTSLHRVQPVTRGARVASFFWIQSMVRDDGQRTLLFDLDLAIQRLGADDAAGHPALVQLTGVYHNLLRRWADAS